MCDVAPDNDADDNGTDYEEEKCGNGYTDSYGHYICCKGEKETKISLPQHWPEWEHGLYSTFIPLLHIYD